MINYTFSITDSLIFIGYFILIIAYGWYIYKLKQSKEQTTGDYFLAEGTLTWWAIGASIIASNISAEQFVGMSGSGFTLGLAISSYEWIAALTLIIVALFFMPIYLKNKIYTMPQFLQKRYDSRVSAIMAVFWLLLYIFVNLTSILYLGAITLSGFLGIDFFWCCIILSFFAFCIALGGMRVIGYTDVIQVFFLVLGGLITTYLALRLVSTTMGLGHGALEGFSIMKQKAPEHFKMIFEKGKYLVDNGSGQKEDPWQQLPGLSVLIGGMWIANLSYWGCNQYITQRALGAKLNVSRSGLLFAGFLKLLFPVLVVVPGIACYILYSNHAVANITNTINVNGIVRPDRAYSAILTILPTPIKGIVAASITAAIVASLAGKVNGISTIFTLDIYKKYYNKVSSESNSIFIGKMAILISFIIAISIAPMLKSFGQGFNYIQEYTGFITPAIFSIFLLGLFWKRANTEGAIVVTLLSIPLSIFYKFLFPAIPFLNRMAYVSIISIIIMVIFGLLIKPRSNELETKWKGMFDVNIKFIISCLIIVGIVAALYIVYW